MPQPVKFYNTNKAETSKDVIDYHKVDVETPKEETETPKLTHDQLHDALFYSEMMLERSLLPFIVLGETAKCIVDSELPNLIGDSIELGILRSEATHGRIETLKSLVNDIEVDKDYITFVYNKVRVMVKLLDNKPYFTNPDVRYYHVTEFKIPNPFDSYWEDRNK